MNKVLSVIYEILEIKGDRPLDTKFIGIVSELPPVGVDQKLYLLSNEEETSLYLYTDDEYKLVFSSILEVVDTLPPAGDESKIYLVDTMLYIYRDGAYVPISGSSESTSSTKVVTYKADLATIVDPNKGDIAIVLLDETHGALSALYTYNGTNWIYLGEFTTRSRDFITDPIDLESEVTGTLPLGKVENGEILVEFNEDSRGRLHYGDDIVSLGMRSTKQVTKANVVATPEDPHISVIPIDYDNQFNKLPVEVLKARLAEDVVETLMEFNNTDASDFITNDSVEFDGTMHLKTEYLLDTQKVKDDIYSFDLDRLNIFTGKDYTIEVMSMGG